MTGRLGFAALVLCAVLSLASSCAKPPAVREGTGFVMGTVAQLKVVDRDAEKATVELSRALEELQRIERLSTTHDEESQVSRLNRAAGAWVDLRGDTDALLALASDVAERSGGAFDPLAGSFVRLWGFPEHAALPADDAIAAILAAPAVLERRGDGEWRIHPGVRTVDLGGVAKGWAVDRAADLLAATGSCLVNAGGDLAVRGMRPDGKGWLIGIQDPRDPSRLFLKVRVSGQRAVATSGDYQRFFEVDGVRYHHLLDPRTGRPARDVRSATVIAPTCALADAWATAAFVLGPRDGVAALEAQPDLEGVLVTEDERGELVLHETSGFGEYKVP